MAQVVEHLLEGGQAGGDVEVPDVAHVADADDLALGGPAAPVDGDVVRAGEPFHHPIRIHSQRHLHGGESGARSGLREQGEAEGLRSRAGGSRQAVVTPENVGQAFLVDHAQHFAQADHDRHRRSEARLVPRGVLPLLAEIEIELGKRRTLGGCPCFLAEGEQAQARGSMRPFCEAETTTSIPQASMGSRAMPRLETASTMRMASVPRVTCAYPRTSWSTPVDDSLCWTSTALTSACSRSAWARRSGGTVSPCGASSSTTARPKALAMASQRWANAPALTTITRSPADSVFATAASMAPVPVHAGVSTSCSVWTRRLRSPRTSRKSASYSAAR